jgi:polysaccharide export outer membrane protein
LTQAAEQILWRAPTRVRAACFRVCAWCWCLAVFFLACSPFGVARAADEPFYLIGPGDGLEITVRNEPELSRSIVVRPDGRLTVPLVEDLAASGLTPTELAKAIENRLTAYIQDPVVSVTVLSPSGVFDERIRIVGYVGQPASMPYQAGLTVLDAITQIGGLDIYADGNAATIKRRTADGTEEIKLRLDDLIRRGDLTANVALRPGDIIIVPEGFFDGINSIDYGAITSLTYTDNINLQSSGAKTSALIYRAGGDINASTDMARFQGNLNGYLDLVFITDDTNPSLDGRVVGRSTSELARNHLYLDVDIGYNRVLLDAGRGQSASSNVPTNRDNTITLSASPWLVHRVGDFADSIWRYRISPVVIDSTTNPNSLTHSVSNGLTGRNTSRKFGWNLFTNVGQTIRDTSSVNTPLTDTTEFADTNLSLNYAILRSFSVIGGIGYIYRSGDRVQGVNQADGIMWDAGFDWTPGPRTSLSATYGQRDQDTVYSGALRHSFSPYTDLTVTYSDHLLTDQERFVQSLSNSTTNSQGQIIDPSTGLPLNPNSSSANFTAATTRTQLLQGSVRHGGVNGSLTLFGSANRQTGGFNSDLDTYRLSLMGTRGLSRMLSANGSLNYTRDDFDVGGRVDDIYFLNAGLVYQIHRQASANFNYSFQDHNSTLPSREFTENTASVGLSIRF